MKKAILVAIIGAMTLGVNAGDWGKAPVGKAPIEECIDLGGEITVGYMSDYFYRGYHVATSSVYGEVNYTFDGLAVPITIGAWYLNGVDAPVFQGRSFDELQLSASADLGTVAGFDLDLAYIHHFYPEGLSLIPNGNAFGAGDDLGEVSLRISRDLGFATLVGSANYYLDDTTNAGAFGFGGRDLGLYGNVGLERAFGITDNISLVLAGGVGYVDMLGNTPFRQRGWNHYYLQASLPIQLNCRTTLTPYIGYNNQASTTPNSNPVSALGGLPVDDSVVHGGVALSVTF